VPAQVVVALTTPFRPDGAVDLDALARHVTTLLQEGVDALMPCGTTGEGPLLGADEIVAVVARVVQVADGSAEVLAHVGRPSTAATVELARRALDAGAIGVSAVVPYFYGLSDAEVVEHYRSVLAAAEGVPVYAYTIPARTGNELSIEAVRELAAAGLRGVKDSTKSWARHVEYLATGVDVLIGTDALVVDSFRAGSAGCVSALANVRPDLLRRARDGEDVQDEISALRERLPFPRLKDAVAERLIGYPTSYRAPLR
jgi:dihydrodipicolinate synthase/N-acetylneuraminate lyase